MTEVAHAPVLYEAPPRTRNAEGQSRRVGLEVEFGNLDVEEATRVVVNVLGGRIVHSSPTRGEVEGTRFGSFKVELDATPIRERAYLEPLERLGLDADGPTARVLEDSVVRLAREIVPVEIVTPPVPWDELEALDALWVALRDAGARGTHDSFFHAFGLHLNPEPPDLQLSTVLAYLQSYLLLGDWIREEIGVDFSRRIAPFVDPFPPDYCRRVVDSSYFPDWPEFVADYLQWNPTRNRSLDLLPLIVHVRRVDLQDRVDNWSKVKPRPAFHYRLPNSELERPGWTPAPDWNLWVMVERAAEHRPLLDELMVDYVRFFDVERSSEPSDWTEHVKSRISRLRDPIGLSGQ